VLFGSPGALYLNENAETGGRRAPSGAARTLLMIAAKNPRALLDVA
jgi:hypothetical protein